MLLSHTAGMKDFLGKRSPEMMKNGVKRAAEFIPLYENDEPRFDQAPVGHTAMPGLRWPEQSRRKFPARIIPTISANISLSLRGMKDSDPNNIPAGRVLTWLCLIRT